MNSDNVKKGPERAPNRSLFYALGYTPEELERPLIGVVSAHSEIVPGHMNLDKIADAVKAGTHSITDLIHFHIGKIEKLTGFLNLNLIKITQWGISCTLQKQIREI